METKRTPGPWRVFKPDDYEGPGGLPGLGIESENGSAVIWYADRAESGIANDEDAPMIASAPELLGALEDAQRLLRRCHEAMRLELTDDERADATKTMARIRTAIASATYCDG